MQKEIQTLFPIERAQRMADQGYGCEDIVRQCNVSHKLARQLVFDKRRKINRQRMRLVNGGKRKSTE